MIVNPGGPNNAESLGFLQDASRRYWALYEFKGAIPTDATQVTLTIDDGRADAAAQGASTGGNGNDNYVDMVIFDAIQSTVVVNDPALKIIVNRDNGNITISNGTGVPQQIKGYSILSDAGALDETSTTFFADSDSNWVRFSAPGATSDLSEGHLTTDTIGVAETISLGNDAWIKYFDADDLKFEYLDGNGELVTGLVQYAGTTVPAPFVFGDLTFDGNVNRQDWIAYTAGLGTDLSGQTDAQSYAEGDMNGDQLNNHADFLLFEGAYDEVNGSGAFTAMVAGVPEPGSLTLMAFAGFGLATSSRRRTR